MSQCNSVDENLDNAISKCKTGDQYGLQRMIETGKVDMHAVDFHGNSLLYYACLCGSSSMIVRYLSDIGLRDCKYHRCWWNSLSMNERNILKLYNSYKTNEEASTTKSKKEDVSLNGLLDRYLKRIIYQSQNNEDFDCTLKLKFSDQKAPIEYKCHWWIILARWPEIVYFVNNKIDTDAYPVFSYSDYELSLKSNKRIEEDQKLKFPKETPKKLYNIIQKEKHKIQKLKQDYLVFSNNVSTDFTEGIPTDEESLREYMQTNLKFIDFGEVPLGKAHFNRILGWIYTGEVTQQLEELSTLLCVAKRFKIRKLFHNLLIQFKNKTIPVKKEMVEELYKDLSIIPLFKTFENMDIFSKMRRITCNMGVTCKHSENTQEIIIPCHKQFIMDRSEFFHVIINCQFEEGNKFREQESRKELPIIELYQSLSKESISSILNFIYCDKIDLNKANFIEMQNLGELLGLPNLVNQCYEYLLVEKFYGEELLDLYKYSLSCGNQLWIKHLERKAIETSKKHYNKEEFNALLDEMLNLGADPKTIAKYSK